LELLGPITLFVSVYLATFLAIAYAAMAVGLHYHQWAALLGVICASAFTIRITERGRWRLGIFVPPPMAAGDLLRGALFAAVLILVVDGVVLLTTNLRHVRGAGFPWLELVTVFAPARSTKSSSSRLSIPEDAALESRRSDRADFDRLRRAPRIDRGISTAAIVNLIIAGVLLALAYEKYQRLWFPIGIHLVWNVLSGPILGYGVSGYAAEATVFRTVGSGPVLVTGGAFGIEGSVWMAVVELGGIFWLARGFKRIA